VSIIIPEESVSEKVEKAVKNFEKPRKKVLKVKKHKELKKTQKKADKDVEDKTPEKNTNYICPFFKIDPIEQAKWDADQEAKRKLFNNLNFINKLLILPTLTILATIAIDNHVVALLRTYAYGY